MQLWNHFESVQIYAIWANPREVAISSSLFLHVDGLVVQQVTYTAFGEMEKRNRDCKYESLVLEFIVEGWRGARVSHSREEKRRIKRVERASEGAAIGKISSLLKSTTRRGLAIENNPHSRAKKKTS